MYIANLIVRGMSSCSTIWPKGILTIITRREFSIFIIFLMHIHVLMLCRKFELILIKIGFLMNF